MSFLRKIKRNAERRARTHLLRDGKWNINEHGREGPQVGDVCVGCVHKPNPNGANYFMIATPTGEPNLHVMHPVTKQHAMAKWVLLCDACLLKFGDNIEEAVEKQKIPLTNIMTWRKEDGQVIFDPS